MSEPVPEQPRPGPHVGPDAGPEAAIQAALARLDGLDDRPVDQHAAAFEELHGALTEALSSIDGV